MSNERIWAPNQLRSCAHGAYAIFFTVNDQGVRIERILHGSRDLNRLLNE